MLVLTQSRKSFTNNKNNRGPSTDPCGTPLRTSDQVEYCPLTTTLINLLMKRLLFARYENVQPLNFASDRHLYAEFALEMFWHFSSHFVLKFFRLAIGGETVGNLIECTLCFVYLRAEGL